MLLLLPTLGLWAEGPGALGVCLGPSPLSMGLCPRGLPAPGLSRIHRVRGPIPG